MAVGFTLFISAAPAPAKPFHGAAKSASRPTFLRTPSMIKNAGMYGSHSGHCCHCVSSHRSKSNSCNVSPLRCSTQLSACHAESNPNPLLISERTIGWSGVSCAVVLYTAYSCASLRAQHRDAVHPLSRGSIAQSSAAATAGCVAGGSMIRTPKGKAPGTGCTRTEEA